jgi:MFS family permease
VGTPLGGYLMDKYCTVSTTRTSTDGQHHYNNTKILILNAASSGLGCILLCMIYFIQDKAIYILLITLGATVIFMAMSGANMAVMMAVPIAHRSFAIALCSIIIHTFGDVPSPIITGYIKDKLAPGCVGDDDAVAVSPGCRDDEAGLRMTMLIVSIWIWWSVMFNFLAAVLSHYKIHSFSLGHRYSQLDTRGLLDLDDENVAGEDKPSVHGNYT